jgi:hypothetical protein
MFHPPAEEYGFYECNASLSLHREVFLSSSSSDDAYIYLCGSSSCGAV